MIIIVNDLSGTDNKNIDYSSLEESGDPIYLDDCIAFIESGTETYYNPDNPDSNDHVHSIEECERKYSKE